mmetsp:Transcript_153196/g.389183  ORF Transcript_153196/g.389183 Transcript_153196/m.389183 type:complete len:252 (-) Transcript_153196:332-1087(-)
MDIETSTVSIRDSTFPPTSKTEVGEDTFADMPIEVVRPVTLSREEWKDLFHRSHSQSHKRMLLSQRIVGSWTTNGGTFHIEKRPSKDEVMFRQGSLSSIMTKEGDWWSGVVRNDSDLHLVHGQLRLRREGRCLRSNFKKDFREDWGADTFAHPGGWHRAAGKLARRQQHHIVMLQAKQAELAKQQEQAKQANCVAQSPQRPGLALGWAWLPRWATSQAPPVLSMGSVASAPAARTARTAVWRVLQGIRRAS